MPDDFLDHPPTLTDADASLAPATTQASALEAAEAEATPALENTAGASTSEQAVQARVTLTDIRATLKQADSQSQQLETQLQQAAQPQPVQAKTVPPTLWHIPATQAWFFGLMLLTTIVVVGIRLFKLTSIQTDVYGDIQIV